MGGHILPVWASNPQVGSGPEGDEYCLVPVNNFAKYSTERFGSLAEGLPLRQLPDFVVFLLALWNESP